MAFENLLAAAQGSTGRAKLPTVAPSHRINRATGKYNQKTIVKPGPLTQAEIENIADALGLIRTPNRVKIRAWQYVKDAIAGRLDIDRDAIVVSAIRKGYRGLGTRNVGQIVSVLTNF